MISWPRAINQRAKRMVDIGTGQASDEPQEVTGRARRSKARELLARQQIIDESEPVD